MSRWGAEVDRFGAQRGPVSKLSFHFSGFQSRAAFLGRGFCSLVILLVFATVSVAQSPVEPTIRTIRVEVREIFEDQDLGLFYRTVNGIKIDTREEVIRRELLFKEGDKFDSFVLAESARNLRSLPFLRNISITPHREGDVVDIVVSVQDTWTLFPFLSYASGGGTNKQSIGIAETNLAGYGKRVEVLYAEDEGRQKIEGVYDDRRLFGTYQQLTVGIFDRSDGYRSVGFYGRPFRSLVEPYSWSVDTDFFDLVGKLFEAGDERFIFRQRRQALSAGFTVARGNPEDVVRRYTLGYDYSSDEFSAADENDFDDVDVDPNSVSQDPAQLASDRKFSGPFIALQQISPDFISLNYVDRFERVEDFNLGNELYGRMTFAADALGSRRDTLLFNVSDSDGTRFSPTQFLRGKVGVTTRGDSDGFRNTLASFDVRYYNVLGAKYLGDTYVGRHTLVGSLSADFGDDLDRDRELLLGATNGLRAYEDRTFVGSQRLLLTLEERVHIVEDVYKLVSIGGAIFFDAGGTSTQGFGDILDDRLQSDVGIGLRFGFPRSSGGSVLRVDLAFPLRDGPDGSQVGEPRLLVTTGQVSTARLPAESQQSPGSNVTVKFIP